MPVSARGSLFRHFARRAAVRIAPGTIAPEKQRSQQSRRDDDAAIRPGHSRRRAFRCRRSMAGRSDRRQGSGPGQGRIPPRQALRRRTDRPRGQLSAEDGPRRGGRQVPPGQPGHGVQPVAVGVVVPEASRDARPRLRRPASTAGHAAAQARRVGGRRDPPVVRGERPRTRRERSRRRRRAQGRREGATATR